MLAISLPTFLRFGHDPVGQFGFVADLDGTITFVQPDSPAARAGIQVKDRLDLAAMPASARREADGSVVAGTVRNFPVVHDGIEKRVTLVALSEPLPFGTKVTLTIRELIAFLFIGIGAMVVLRRPGRTTWAFFTYCLGAQPGSNIAALALVPQAVYLPIFVFFLLVVAASQPAVLVFALRFGRPRFTGWRTVCDRLAPYLFVPFGIIMAGPEVLYTLYGVPVERFLDSGFVLVGLMFIASVVLLLESYIHGPAAERERIRWVVVAYAVGTGAWYLGHLLANTTIIPITTPYWVVSLLWTVEGVVPLAIGYAIIRHRVFDLNFAISRALVYGVLTTFFVGVLALIDWFVGKVLAQTQLAIVSEVAAAVAIGFGLNGLHRRVDYIIDAALFRKRHSAERRLARVAAGLPHARSSTVVDDMLTVEPADALGLASAALFRRVTDGHFVRVASMGWAEGTVSELTADDTLVLHLEGEHGPLRLSDVRWNRPDLPPDVARPVLAVPIIVRHQFAAIVLYGAHASGEDIDPDEVRAINGVAVSAAAAYDHLEAEALRREVEELRRQLQLARSGAGGML